MNGLSPATTRADMRASSMGSTKALYQYARTDDSRAGDATSSPTTI
jgi:hypothetical protein